MVHFQASKPRAAKLTQSSKMQYTVEKRSSALTGETAAARQTDEQKLRASAIVRLPLRAWSQVLKV